MACFNISKINASLFGSLILQADRLVKAVFLCFMGKTGANYAGFALDWCFWSVFIGIRQSIIPYFIS